ncbi:unnamed protein product [Camellia sinensis]
MELEQSLPYDRPSMTFDEVSMERSKNFVKALQELKNLRPQLYSAAEYCEKSYLCSEQKESPILNDVDDGNYRQMMVTITVVNYENHNNDHCLYLLIFRVLDNLKDYAVRALVNAVDHLGTVASKLTDLVEQQTSDVSAMALKVSCLNQIGAELSFLMKQLLTCQTYTDKEGLRQQQLLAFIPRHHKHYILPTRRYILARTYKQMLGKVIFRQDLIITRQCIPASKTLSWHLASETKSTLKAAPHALTSSDNPKTSEKTSGVFHLVDAEESTRMKSSATHLQLSGRGHASSAAMQPFSAARREGSKPLTAFKSFDNPNRLQIIRAPVRSKSLLSSFFVKQKKTKLKTIS